MVTIGEFRVGEDISIALDAVSGDVGSVTEVTAAIRLASQGSHGLFFVQSALAVPMTVVSRAAAGEIPAG